MNYTSIEAHVEQYVRTYIQKHTDEKLVYHNISHTESVVKAAKKIADYYKITDKERFIVIAAAWLHDIGYFTDPRMHEKVAADEAEKLLKSLNVDTETIHQVQGCIMATKMPQAPTNLLEQILCDADLFHLGTDNFSETNKLIRKECELILNYKIPKEDWRRNALLLLSQHKYHTDFSKNLLEKGKQKNIEKLKQKEYKKEETPEKEVSENKPEKPSKGIETMFRITSNNHQRLSDMADNKAHIMITTTSIIISVLLTVLLRKLEEYPHLTIPTIVLLLICVITMVFSILATRPSIPSGNFTDEDIRQQKTNLLFFGNFYNMPLMDYKRGMETMMNDAGFLYGSMIQDIHSQGVVLGRKYKLLRIAYNVFMFGIIISVVSFVIASLYFKG